LFLNERSQTAPFYQPRLGLQKYNFFCYVRNLFDFSLKVFCYFLVVKEIDFNEMGSFQMNLKLSEVLEAWMNFILTHRYHKLEDLYRFFMPLSSKKTL